ncbi:lysophospholipase-like protein 1 [Anastrepha ludens]|uniref:lysophospholipase-like protein 1 n=1 Tax=Anastrepha ludens TaxID=28586 RepID=UPI0023B1D975|nr:lysophospholipase-like protein 1 [Anastrepha ludens]
MNLVLRNTHPTTRLHSATVIFFHGSGDTGSNLLEWIRFLLGRDMEFAHIKVIYPTAPFQAYTPLGGESSNVWFDRRSISIDALEDRKSISRIYEKVCDLIKNEQELGISPNRIIVGGFSMGGALALHTGFHLNTDLAGVFACSSFLNSDSIVYESLSQKLGTEFLLPEMRMYHGDRDTLVPLEWGKGTYEKLIQLGAKGNFISLDNTLHELKKRQLLDIQEWILKKLPPLESESRNKL